MVDGLRKGKYELFILTDAKMVYVWECNIIQELKKASQFC